MAHDHGEAFLRAQCNVILNVHSGAMRSIPFLNSFWKTVMEIRSSMFQFGLRFETESIRTVCKILCASALHRTNDMTQKDPHDQPAKDFYHVENTIASPPTRKPTQKCIFLQKHMI